jgi:hypothetical protein
VDTGGEFLANLNEAGAHFVVGRIDGLGVFAANLLLDEGLTDELIERAPGSESTLSGAAGIEDGEADLFVDVAGQDEMAVDGGDYGVKDYRGLGAGRNGESGEKNKDEKPDPQPR